MTTKKDTIFINKEIINFLDTIYMQGEKTLIAISGGSDSIYVSLIMQYYRKNKNRDIKDLYYIYCDHGIRENNSDKKHIKKYVSSEQLYIIKREPNKKNTEASLRRWRYEQIEAYMKNNKIHNLITGHHLSDRIESTFLNLLRGCAIDGFISMQRVEKNSHLIQGKIIRPLLMLSKTHIQAICDTNNILYSYDTTNEDITVSKRNKLRHTILKSLRELSHKETTEENSFENSMHEIYAAIEHTQEGNAPIEIETVPMYKHRDTKRAYKRNINHESITTNIVKKLCKQLHIQNNMHKKNIKELSEFLQKKNKGHKYINHTYFFISQGCIYIINGPKKFWEKTTTQHPKNIVNLFNQPVEKKIIKDRCFNTGSDRIHGKPFKKRCTNQKIPIFRRENIISEIQGDKKLKPIIWNFMKSTTTNP